MPANHNYGDGLSPTHSGEGLRFKYKNPHYDKDDPETGPRQLWKICAYPDGSAIPAQNRREARQFKNQWELKLERQQQSGRPLQFSKLSVFDYGQRMWEGWTDDEGFHPHRDRATASGRPLSESTRRAYMHVLRSPRWPKTQAMLRKPVAEITHLDLLPVVQAWIDAGLTGTTIESYLTPLRKLFTWAWHKDDLRFDNPVTAVEAKLAGEWVKARQSQIDPLTEAEFSDLLGWTDERRRNVIALGGYAGPRISEALGLIWEDIDFDDPRYGTADWRPTISFRRQLDPRTGQLNPWTKTSEAGRRIDMHPLLYPYLKEQRRRCGIDIRPDDRVFAGVAAKGIGETLKEWATLRRRVNREGFKDFSFHQLRHTYVSHLLDNPELPVAYVARQIGDTIETVTNCYAHLIERRESGVHAAAHGRTFSR